MNVFAVQHYLYLTLAQKWPDCHWPWCNSSVGLWTGAGTPGCQSSPPQPHWAWFPRSSGRSAAAWAPDLGCCHRGWVECPVRSTGGPLLVTYKERGSLCQCIFMTASYPSACVFIWFNKRETNFPLQVQCNFTSECVWLCVFICCIRCYH